MRVLLIDDEQFYFKLIRKTLKEAEYELEYAQSGNEGLAKIPVFNPELLIVDLKLPGMDGFQILERLRRDTKFSHVPVIVITAQDELSEKTYQPGAYTSFYINEPKKRLISAAPFRDRVVHHALCNITVPYFEKLFIPDSYANQRWKGTHRACY